VNALKPLILLTILGGVGFFVYRSLNRAPGEPPSGTDTSVTASPEIKLGEATRSKPGASGNGANLLHPSHQSIAPAFSAGDAGSNTTADAPPFSGNSLPPTDVTSASPFNAVAANEQRPSPPNSTTVTNSPEVRPGATPGGGMSDARERSQSFSVAWAAIQPKLASGQLSEALQDLTAWRNHPSLAPAEHSFVDALLSQLAGTVIYSREHLLAAPYRVQVGDRLEAIAEKYKVTPELLAKINGLDPARPLEPGQEIKVVPGPFSAVLEVGADRLTLLLDGRYAGSFAVAELGRTVAEKAQSGAPVELTINQKTTSPIYNSPQGEIEPGDPANPLGQQLIALGGEFAIHGTNPRATAQTQQPSAGIRLNAEDMGELYDILTVGSRVIVRR